MTSMIVSLPEDLKKFFNEQVQRGYSTASEFVRELIRNAQKEVEKQKRESALLAGLDSGPSTPMTDKDWAWLRAKAEKRRAKRTNAGENQ